MTSQAAKDNHTPDIKYRELEPSAKATKNGIVMMCPFCSPTHPLIPTEPSICGTSIKVTAVQEVISSRSARILELICVKCGEIGGGKDGEMVRYMNGYVHVNKDCSPKTRLLPEMPKFSKLAAIIYKTPPLARSWLEKRLGIVQIVKEITPDGKETGKILGHFFARS